MRTAILGCGRWGAFLAWYAAGLGHETTLWGRPGSSNLEELRHSRKNGYLELPAQVTLTDSLADALAAAELIVVAIRAQQLRSLCARIAGQGPVSGKTFVLCMKGLEAETGKRLSEVVDEELSDRAGTAVWVGPGHVQEFVRGVPNCMLMDSRDHGITDSAIRHFHGELIRFYYGQDLIGNEIGAAAKNVIGIAAGMLDGFGLGTLKGALMARGAREVGRLIEAMGGDALTAYGLSHLGDYEATLFSPHSHNRRFGELFARGEPFEKLAEGVATAKALQVLAHRCDVDLPICCAVCSILFEKRSPQDALRELFLRPIKPQF